MKIISDNFWNDSNRKTIKLKNLKNLYQKKNSGTIEF